LLTGVAFVLYREGASFDMRFQRKTREEAPVQFRAGVAAFSCLSLMFFLLAVRDVLRG
jgi:hypothetical protein